MQTRRKENIILYCFSIVLLIFNLSKRTNSYNTTMLVFSYKYGFIPRSLIGSIYQGLNRILPWNMNTYEAVNRFTLIATIIFVILLVVILNALSNKVAIDDSRCSSLLKAFLVIMIVPTFSGYYNFGRVDMYMVLLTMVGVFLIVKDRALWLILPIVAICECIHEGYVFMYFNVILALLAFQCVKYYTSMKQEECNVKIQISSEHKDGTEYESNEVLDSTKRHFKKLVILTVLTILIVSGLFLWFRLSKPAGQEAYDSIYKIAKKMCYHGKPHKDVIKAEILGVDLTHKELKYRKENIIELIAFIVLFSPFINVVIGFFKRAMASCPQKIDKYRYFVLAIGGLTTLPLFLMKVDYGRWVFALVVYYSVMILTMICSDDEIGKKAFKDTIDSIKGRYKMAILLLPYAMLFSPFCDLSIGKFMYLIYSLPTTLSNF